MLPSFVIPAKAGTQTNDLRYWVPVYTGMTVFIKPQALFTNRRRQDLKPGRAEVQGKVTEILNHAFSNAVLAVINLYFEFR